MVIPQKPTMAPFYPSTATVPFFHKAFPTRDCCSGFPEADPFGPPSVQFKGRINGGKVRKRHQKRHLEVYTALSALLTSSQSLGMFQAVEVKGQAK